MLKVLKIFLVLAFASSSIGHKVLTVPLTMHHDNTQVIHSATSLHSNLGNLGLKDVDEEFEVDTTPYLNNGLCISMWYPDIGSSLEQRYVMDLNASWVAIPVRSCNDCLKDLSKLPKQLHD